MPDETRLVDGGMYYEGRVEYCQFGVWGTICDNGWTAEEAAVVCTKLDFPSEGKFSDACVFLCVSVSRSDTTITGAKAFDRARYGQGTGPLCLTNFDCDGMESSLKSCTRTEACSCNHSEDAGVRCIGKVSDWISSQLEN